MLACNISILNYISICVFDPTSNVLILNYPVNIKAKQPESGDLCGNITEFGVVEGSPESAGRS